MSRLTPAAAEKMVAKFNRLYPVGDGVYWRSYVSDAAPYKYMTVKTPAFVANGQPVVFFQERSGYCSIEPEFVKYD